LFLYCDVCAAGGESARVVATKAE